MNMDIAPAVGFHKLQFLLQQTTFPKETFANLLILYIKYEYFDLAADVMAENSSLAFEYLTPELYDFIEAVVMRQAAPQDAYKLEVFYYYPLIKFPLNFFNTSQILHVHF